jgi:hypothetical protein
LTNLESQRQELIRERFLISLRRHLTGLRRKIEQDFSEENFERELRALETDPVYSKFAFDSPEYVLVRLIGRMSISIGRRLGEIYDKIPRFLAAARFGLTPEQVAPTIVNLELDIALRYSLLGSADIAHAQKVVEAYLSPSSETQGLGIEIRYNFNPNDSARLRKDVVMAEYVQSEQLLPIYLIYSAISPRIEAISRLERAGWSFLTGAAAIAFTRALFGLDLDAILDEPEIKKEIRDEVDALLATMIRSHAFTCVLQRHCNNLTFLSRVDDGLM